MNLDVKSRPLDRSGLQQLMQGLSAVKADASGALEAYNCSDVVEHQGTTLETRTFGKWLHVTACRQRDSADAIKTVYRGLSFLAACNAVLPASLARSMALFGLQLLDEADSRRVVGDDVPNSIVGESVSSWGAATASTGMMEAIKADKGAESVEGLLVDAAIKRQNSDYYDAMGKAARNHRFETDPNDWVPQTVLMNHKVLQAIQAVNPQG